MGVKHITKLIETIATESGAAPIKGLQNFSNVRLATLGELVNHVLPNFIAPIPTPETLRTWFDSARIPRMKSNPLAKRGGGATYYSVAAVEKFFRSRTLPGKVNLN